MTHFFHFEQLDRRDSEPRQEFEHISESKNRSPLPTAAQLTRIFSAFIGSLVMVLSFTIFQPPNAQAVVAMYPLLMLALQVIFAGTMLAAGAVLFAGIPLAVVAWHSTPRTRFLFAVPFLTFALPLLVTLLRFLMLPLMGKGIVMVIAGAVLFAGIPLAVVAWRSIPRTRFLFAVPLLLLLVTLLPFHPFMMGIVLVIWLLYGIPIISTIAINRAIRQAALPDKWLRFARLPSRLVVFALIMMFLGVLSWGVCIAVFAPALFLSLSAPLNLPLSLIWLLMCIGMLICVIVAARATSSRPRPHHDYADSFASDREQAQSAADPMTYFFHFEPLNRRSKEPGQGFEHVSESRSRSPFPTAAQLRKIFSTFIGLLVTGLSFTLLLFACALPLLALILIGLATNVLPPSLPNVNGDALSYGLPIIGSIANVIFFYGIPIISIIAINRVIRQIALPDKMLRFARFLSPLVVFVLTVMFLWLLAWGAYSAVFAPELFLSFLTHPPYPSWLITLIGMLICVIVAAQATTSQPRQYDDSLHDVASNREQAQPPADPTGE